MMAREVQTGMTVKHEGEWAYLKTKSFTMGNIIHATLRLQDGSLVTVQWLTEEDVEVYL